MIRAICSFIFTSREQNLAVSQSRATHNTTMSVQQQLVQQVRQGSLHCTENACGLCPLQVTPTMELAHVRDLRFV